MQNNTLFGDILNSDRSAREKNLTALLILIGGLFLGSLLVDAVGLFTGTGFSGKAVREHNLLEAGGKTWVAYTDPMVTLQVVTEEACLDCSPNEALLWLRRIAPTIDAVRVEATSPEGENLIKKYELKTLPSFVFTKSIEKTAFFEQAGPLFSERNGQYVFDMNKIGLPVGKYLVAPQTSDEDIQLGKKDASVKMVVFSDFQCQFCKNFHAESKKVLAAYGEKVSLVFKHWPLPAHAQGETAAMASECANDQGKFMEYADLLFDKQAEWGKTKGNQKFKDYAWRVMGMNGRDFATCLDTKKHADKVAQDIREADELGLTSAPSSFVNTQLVVGAAPFADLKTVIEAELGE
ncbi:MAG: DsbA family protein [Candidatus Moraniibacteriota bacterium]